MSDAPLVLAAIDFDPTGDAALGRAAAVATRRGGRLVAVHVVDDRMGNLGRGLAGGAGGPAGRDELEPAARRALEERLAVAKAPEAEARVLFGAPTVALVEEAERTGAALLVAGVHRRGGGLLGLGHTAGYLVVHAPCPVLLVHADDGARAAPQDPDHRPRVLLAVEPDDAAAAAAADALRLLAPPDREDGGLELVLLEAVHAPALTLGGEVPGHDAEHAERRSPELAALERAAARLRARGHAVPELEAPARVTASELLERAAAREVDLVVTALRRGGLLARLGGGAAGRAAPRLPCPLLAVPLSEGERP